LYGWVPEAVDDGAAKALDEMFAHEIRPEICLASRGLSAAYRTPANESPNTV